MNRLIDVGIAAWIHQSMTFSEEYRSSLSCGCDAPLPTSLTCRAIVQPGGGGNGDGTVFKITSTGKLTTLYSFGETEKRAGDFLRRNPQASAQSTYIEV